MPVPAETAQIARGDEEQGAKDATLNRACEYCRGLKVRCFPEPGSSSSTCQRCARSKRICVFAPPQRRKQRKRTDARVAELEREMKALRSLLNVGGGRGDQGTQDAPVPDQDERTNRAVQDTAQEGHRPPWEGNGDSIRSPGSQLSTAKSPFQLLDRGGLDVVSRGVLSMPLASELYSTYVNELAAHYPAVIFPEFYTAEDLRQEKPILFLAVMTAASTKTDPNLYRLLNLELSQEIASRTVTSGEKNLEFVQAMLLTAVWYRPTDTFDQLKFYQYIHMAATIAVDIGLGSKPNTLMNTSRPQAGIACPEDQVQSGQCASQKSKEHESDTASIDAKRTILVCYLICSGVALSMRRQNMLRFNSWMRECINFLETYPQVTLFDKRLVARVKLQNIAEEFASAFSLDDPDDESIVLDSRTQLSLKAFERRLKDWRENLDPEITNSSMLMIYYHTAILLHEIAIHDDHPAANFKPPYFLKFTRPDSKEREQLTAPVIDAIMQCVTFSHDLLDTFLSLDVGTLRAMPVYKYVMVCYTVLLLTKLTQSVNNPASEIGKVLDHSGLALARYSDAVITQVARAAGSQEFLVPSKFLGVLLCFRSAAARPVFPSGVTGVDTEAVHPLRHIALNESNAATSTSPDKESPASGSTNTNVSSSTMPSTSQAQQNNGTSEIDHNPGLQISNQAPKPQTYRPQYSTEQRSGFPAPQSLNELNINYELAMDPSLFSSFTQNAFFTEDMGDWIPTSSAAGQAVDEQMLDLPYWGYGAAPEH